MSHVPSLAAPAAFGAAGASAEAESRWSALDDAAEWEAFSRPVAGVPGTWESYLAIEGMHCAACTLLVEQALMRVPGVRSVDVNGASQTARIVWDPTAAKPSAWLAALRPAGYGAMPAGDLLHAGARLKAQRLMLWRWLVAGFCMMQAMMYALPIYVAAPGEITPDIEALLRWGAWMMTLPVVLFSCWPFFTAAVRDLRQRRIGMDVPVALGIAIAFLASTAATFDPGGPWGDEVWYDSVTMFVFFLLSGRLLEQRLRDRTAGSLQALMRRLPGRVERETADGGVEQVAVRSLRVGDRVRLRPGEVFPADGRIEAGHTRVDEALLTGESDALVRGPGDPVIAGSHNFSGAVTMSIERLGPDTRFAGIVALMERACVDKPQLAQLADRIARPFLLAVLAAAAVAAGLWWDAGAAHAMSVAVAVLIVTCPCALSLATPAASLTAAGALARRGLLVRRLQALDAAARVDTVVFDKTGTLTDDAMALGEVRCRAGVDRAEGLAAGAALASASLHPLSRALAAAGGAGLPQVADVREQAGHGLRGRLCTGALAAGRPDGVELRLGSAQFCDAPEGHSQPGSAQAQVHLADESGWLASFSFGESLRPQASEAIARLRAQGLDVRLLSGDRPAAVRRLAARAGIEHWEAGCTPEDKLSRLRELQRQGRRVLMVGDGMNDGPVLAAADVSVAMGQGVPLAQERADFIVQSGRLAAVVSLVSQGRRTTRVVRQNLAWAAIYNAACVPLAIAGQMPPWLAGLGMAASSLVVVLNAARLARVPGG
ncbi:cation-translocating P-type ATPase [Ramlibacter sp. AW1]|uniref:Cation-translocating P-type ATPase n=1 Tax=Ramlibacter aurantiacus TaxID=2801330 RepID=A0A936ZTT2_9BURK|nr:cation-translocating P-type ATPase [Ramlibacter aurantiacus]MBL0421035.1 cation-translocating P-type ATPase [Ramlibacter aurantiacus]